MLQARFNGVLSRSHADQSAAPLTDGQAGRKPPPFSFHFYAPLNNAGFTPAASIKEHPS